MKPLKRFLILFLIFSIPNLYLPKITFAQGVRFYAEGDLTKHPPEVLSTPEEEMPTEKVVKPAPKWPWVVLGLLIVGGAVAAMAGGGGGGGGGGTTGGGGGTGGGSGSVTVGW